MSFRVLLTCSASNVRVRVCLCLCVPRKAAVEAAERVGEGAAASLAAQEFHAAAHRAPQTLQAASTGGCKEEFERALRDARRFHLPASTVRQHRPFPSPSPSIDPESDNESVDRRLQSEGSLFWCRPGWVVSSSAKDCCR